MVPAYAQDAVAVLLCLLAVPVFPSACLSCPCVQISFCRFALMLSFPISVFVCPCELCSPGANTRIQRGSGVIPRRCRWSFASGSVSLSWPLCQCVLQLDSSYIIGTVSLSLSFISNLSQQPSNFFLFISFSQLSPTHSGPDRYFTLGGNCWRPLPFSFSPMSVIHTLTHSFSHLQYSQRPPGAASVSWLLLDSLSCQSKCSSLIVLDGAEAASKSVIFYTTRVLFLQVF